MNTQQLIQRYTHIQQQLRHYEQCYGRNPDSVTLLAVSKTFPASDILALYRVGQRHFGESYLSEAITKISALSHAAITWHFIGVLQSNKTIDIANAFSWVHTVRRLKDAEQLSQARLEALPPLNICIQVKLDENPKKGGILPQSLPLLVDEIKDLPRIRLRGLMLIPPPEKDFHQQRKYFSHLRNLQAELIVKGIPLDTLSMGMTHDMQAAVAEGATMVRIGTGLFGKRQDKTA